MRRQRAFEDLWVGQRIGARLPWYYAVATNRMPAKYRIAARVPAGVGLAAHEEALWDAHDAATGVFLDFWGEIRSGQRRIRDLPKADPSLLDLSVELARRMLRHCDFCRWNCRVDRVTGTKHGTCQLDSASRVSSYFHHMGEELVLRGPRGSGPIFFTSCDQMCVFCQNSDISRDKDRGIPVTPRELAAMAWQLRMEGCHNINWVGGEPTIHLHTILAAIRELTIGPPQPEDPAYAEAVRSDGFHAAREDL